MSPFKILIQFQLDIKIGYHKLRPTVNCKIKRLPSIEFKREFRKIEKSEVVYYSTQLTTVTTDLFILTD